MCWFSPQDLYFWHPFTLREDKGSSSNYIQPFAFLSCPETRSLPLSTLRNKIHLIRFRHFRQEQRFWHFTNKIYHDSTKGVEFNYRIILGTAPSFQLHRHFSLIVCLTDLRIEKVAEPVNLNPEVAEQLRRGRADEVCIEKLLLTLAWAADGGITSLF